MSIETLVKTRYAKPDQTIREHADKTIEAANYLINQNYIKNNLVCNLLPIACEYHDYGKINKTFQKRITSDKKIHFSEASEVPHNILSIYFLTNELFENDYHRILVAKAIMYHHYCESKTITTKPTLIARLLDECKDDIVSQRSMERFLARNLESLMDAKAIDINSILLKGFLHKCDYAASADVSPEFPNNFLFESLEEMMERWKKKSPESKWNALQDFCYENREKNIIVTAPTGSGKTEAALKWIDNKKGFYVLPLKVAINAIYERIKTNILCNEDIENRLALLHSDTKSKYFSNASYNEDESLDYYVKTKQLSLPLTICTLDQIFDFVSLYQGYEFKLTTLSYSKIVIDEIQMYDPKMLAALIVGIKLIKQLGGQFAILTATLPPLVRTLLREAFDFDVVDNDFTDSSLIRHNVHVSNSFIQAKDVIFQYNKQEDNNKILVVCNSIESAQKLYKEIKEKIGGSNVHLLHSSFTKEDRRKKEEEILKVGKTYGNEETKEINSQKCIWISTPIVEASLDIDFDYLFTELSDLMSLFQRFGRVNRKGVKPVDNYNCFVYIKIYGNIVRHIDKTLYDCSKEAILSINGIITEKQKTELINSYLTEERFASSEYMKEYRKRYKEYENLFMYEKSKNESKIRDFESFTFIPLPIFLRNKEKIRELENSLQSSPSLHKKYEIMEKLSDFSISLSVRSSSRYSFLKKREVEKVKISRKEFLPVLACEYSEEEGAEMGENEKEKEEKSGYAEFI